MRHGQGERTGRGEKLRRRFASRNLLRNDCAPRTLRLFAIDRAVEEPGPELGGHLSSEGHRFTFGEECARYRSPTSNLGRWELGANRGYAFAGIRYSRRGAMFGRRQGVGHTATPSVFSSASASAIRSRSGSMTFFCIAKIPRHREISDVR